MEREKKEIERQTMLDIDREVEKRIKNQSALDGLSIKVWKGP